MSEWEKIWQMKGIMATLTSCSDTLFFCKQASSTQKIWHLFNAMTRSDAEFVLIFFFLIAVQLKMPTQKKCQKF